MVKKYLVSCAFCTLFFMSVSAMLSCDSRSLNRAVDTCVIAIKEQRDITDESLQVKLQFLSDDAVDDVNFSKFLDAGRFKQLCEKAKEFEEDFSTLSGFVARCEKIFEMPSSLTQAQTYILLERVISKLEVLKKSGSDFVPIVFD